jgi:hypothetical protein
MDPWVEATVSGIIIVIVSLVFIVFLHQGYEARRTERDIDRIVEQLRTFSVNQFNTPTQHGRSIV